MAEEKEKASKAEKLADPIKSSIDPATQQMIGMRTLGAAVWAPEAIPLVKPVIKEPIPAGYMRKDMAPLPP